MRGIEGRYALSKSTVSRHRTTCMTAVIAAATTYSTVSRGLDTLDTAESIVTEAQRLGALAESEGDLRTALLGLREMSRAVELLSRLRGEIASSDAPLADPRWVRLRDGLVEVLRPYPDAARAVNALLASELRPAPTLPPGGIPKLP